MEWPSPRAAGHSCFCACPSLLLPTKSTHLPKSPLSLAPIFYIDLLRNWLELFGDLHQMYMFNGHFWPLEVISGQVVLIWINYILNNIWVMVTYLFCYSEIANTLKHSPLVSLRKARIFFLSQSICEPLLQASPLRRRPIWTVNNSWSTPTHSCQLCNVTIILLEQLQLIYTLFWSKSQLSFFLFQKYSVHYFVQSRNTLTTFYPFL